MENSKFNETDEKNPAAIELFSKIWSALEKELGSENLAFPREIFWLNGAPGAGKGTHTGTILSELGLKSQPIVMSDLFKTPEMEAIKATGKLIDDETVIGMLFRALTKPEFREGVLVDGFPRTAGQVACLKLLSKKLAELNAAVPAKFFAPKFTILMLYVTEEESVNRQLKRGKEMKAAGQQVRETDVDPEKTRVRYQIFASTTLAPLQSLEGTFPYLQIGSLGSIEETRENIKKHLSTLSR